MKRKQIIDVTFNLEKELYEKVSSIANIEECTKTRIYTKGIRLILEKYDKEKKL